MADRTIKPDDTHDLVLQNNDGSAKIEVNEAQNIVLTAGSTTALTIDTDGDTHINNNLDSGTIGPSVVFPAGGTGNAVSLAILMDKKALTTEAGTFDQDGWRTRDINFETDPDGIASYTGSTSGTASGGGNMGESFTLIAGTYLITWSCPAYDVVRHITRLYDITGAAELMTGTSQTGQPRSFGAYIGTIGSSNTYEIQHYQETGDVASIGFGLASDIAVNVYTMINIYKIK